MTAGTTHILITPATYIGTRQLSLVHNLNIPLLLLPFKLASECSLVLTFTLFLKLLLKIYLSGLDKNEKRKKIYIFS